MFAVGVEEAAFDEGSESEDLLGAAAMPAHTGEFGALGHDMTAGAFDSPRANEIALGAKGFVGHAVGILPEIGQLGMDIIVEGRREGCGTFGGIAEDFRETVSKERASPLLEERLDPDLLSFKAPAKGVEMLAGMIKVNDLDGPLNPSSPLWHAKWENR